MSSPRCLPRGYAPVDIVDVDALGGVFAGN